METLFNLTLLNSLYPKTSIKSFGMWYNESGLKRKNDIRRKHTLKYNRKGSVR